MFRINRYFRVLAILLGVLALFLGALQAWCYRNTFYMQDAISYLDIADAYARVDWKTAISSYWSPLYSWLIMVIFPVLGASHAADTINLKILNFLIWVATCLSFVFFLVRLVRCYESRIAPELRTGGRLVLSSSALALFLSIVFICQTLSLDGVYMDTADLLSSAFIYLTSGLLFDLAERPSISLAIFFGMVLATGFFSKSVLFPLAFVFLFALWLEMRRRQASSRFQCKVVVAAFVSFFLVCAPFVALISGKAGRLTIGDTGRMNYAHFVARCIPFLEPNQKGTMLAGCQHLKHPPRLILQDPQVFEFSEPVGGCFPPWLDSSYWYDGFEIVFDPTAQFVATVASLSVYVRWFFFPLLYGWIVIWALSRQSGLSRESLRRGLPVLLPALAALTAYALVSNNNLIYSSRYFPAYFTLWFAATALSLDLKDDVRSLRAYLIGTACTIMIFSLALLAELREDLAYGRANAINMDLAIAKALHDEGIKPGDRVADIDGLRRYYWAHLADVKIVAEILDVKRFLEVWQEQLTDRKKLLDDLRKIGVKALVVRFPAERVEQKLPSGWKRLDLSDAYVFMLPQLRPVE